MFSYVCCGIAHAQHVTFAIARFKSLNASQAVTPISMVNGADGGRFFPKSKENRAAAPMQIANCRGRSLEFKRPRHTVICNSMMRTNQLVAGPPFDILFGGMMIPS